MTNRQQNGKGKLKPFSTQFVNKQIRLWGVVGINLNRHIYKRFICTWETQHSRKTTATESSTISVGVSISESLAPIVCSFTGCHGWQYAYSEALFEF